MSTCRTPDAVLFRVAVPVLIFVLGMLHAVDVRAQEASGSAELRGTVSSAETLSPLSGVRVEIPGLAIRTATDARGGFVFGGLPAGSHAVHFRLLGRASHVEEVTLEAGERSSLDVRLETRAIELPAVAVRALRTRMLDATGDLSTLPGSGQLVTRDERQQQPLLSDDIHTLLRRVPGVNVQEEDGYGLRPNIGLRGTGTNRSSKITVMEDGVLVAPAPYASPSAYYFPLVGRMEAVEVRKGSSQIKYGPRTVGGVLNLVSSQIPRDLSGQASMEVGRDNTRKVRGRIGDSHRNVGWLAEAYVANTDGFKTVDGAAGLDTGFDLRDFVTKVRLNSNPDAERYQELQVKLHYYDETSNETYLGLTDPDFRSAPTLRYPASREDVMNAEQRSAQARHFLRLSETLDITTTAYRNEFERNWYKLGSVRGVGIGEVLEASDEHATELAILRGADSGDDALTLRANAREYFSHGIQSNVGIRFGDRVTHELEVGARYHEDEEDRFQHEDGYRMAGGEMILTDPGDPGSQANRVVDARAWSFYLQDRIEMGRLRLTPGVRYENVDLTRTDFATDDPGRLSPERVRENGLDVLIPGIGASYAAAPNVHVFGGVHRGFSPPGPGADDRTEAETSTNYELGLRMNRDGLSATATGFFSDYGNILGRSTLSVSEQGTGEAFNGGEVDVWGLELSSEADAARLLGDDVFASVPVTVAYTFTSARFRSAFESDFGPWGTVEVDDRLPYLPEHQLYASVGLDRPRWGVRLEASHNSRMRTKAGQGAIPGGEGTDSFLVLNASTRYALTRDGELFLGVENLTDRNYMAARRPAGARPGLPRAVVMGVRVSY